MAPTAFFPDSAVSASLVTMGLACQWLARSHLSSCSLPSPWSTGQDAPCLRAKSLHCVRLFATPWIVALQAPPSMGVSRQEYWRRLHFLLWGIFPTQRSNPGLLHHLLRQENSLPLIHQGSPPPPLLEIFLLSIHSVQAPARCLEYRNDPGPPGPLLSYLQAG